nr:immunoglobulin heavy chain junction region [Mus musculus]
CARAAPGFPFAYW